MAVIDVAIRGPLLAIMHPMAHATPCNQPCVPSTGTVPERCLRYVPFAMRPSQYVKQANKPGHSFYVKEEMERMKWERDQQRLQELLRSELCCRMGYLDELRALIIHAFIFQIATSRSRGS